MRPHRCSANSTTARRSQRRRTSSRVILELIAFAGPSMPPVAPPFILGWQEWVALPLLGLPAIKAKVDTGARTSALHAHFVEPYAVRRNRRVRLGVHPIPGRADIEIVCTAPLVDERTVTSSNGDRE